ncbi:MAG: hypothetical protein AB7J35_20645 [Dehalococcoidia bacterium]
MRPLLFLALGGLCGVIATVLFFSIDTNGSSTDAEGAGGGNVALVLSEVALAQLFSQELDGFQGFGDQPVVEVAVGSNGIIRAAITAGGLGVGFRARITVNPNIVDGRLELDVVDSSLGEIAQPEDVAKAMERPLNQRLDAIAAGADYRVTSIRTVDHRLAIEIAV